MDANPEQIIELSKITQSLIWAHYVDPAFLGVLGGLANYFYYIDKNQLDFKTRSFLTTIILAAFVGISAYYLTPNTPNKPGYIMIAGFFCHKIVEFVGNNWKSIFDRIK